MKKTDQKNVIVFGGSGFLGSHVADALMEAGHAVTLFDRVRPRYRTQKETFVEADILDDSAVRLAMRDQQIVYNFAGLADLTTSQEQPVETARTNVLGNTLLLEAARQAGVQRFVFASTMYVAGHAGGFYRASKQSCELFVEEYARWFGLDYTILRYGTVYGRRADDRNSIHRYLKEALTQRRITVLGNGNELREYVHVSDVARASVQILDPAFRNERVVLSGHHPMRFKDLLEMIREMVGPDVKVEFRAVDPTLEEAGKSPHYAVTPYSFRPKMPRKLVGSYYVDLGEGLKDCLAEIHQQTETAPDWADPLNTP